ncbi:MAG: carbon-nitrogen hydrolase family protein [bacterium]
MAQRTSSLWIRVSPINSSESQSNRRWAAIQVDAGASVQENLSTAKELIQEAAESGCSLAALPEFFIVRGSQETIRQNALTLNSDPIVELTRLAREHSVNVLAGSVPIQDPDREGYCYNRSLLIDQSGEITAQYNKIHLFDVDIGDELTVQESDVLSGGDSIVDSSVDGVKVGLTICYDLRFPELYRELSDRGVRVIFVPSNFTRETGRAHWEPLLRARAIENQCYIVAPNQIGKNRETDVASLGQSMIVDPWGQVIARCSDTEGWISGTLDTSYQRRIRRELPSLDHRELS